MHFDHVEATFAEELALILDSDANAVNFLLKFLHQYNLLTIDGDNYYFIEAISHIGTESDAAERMRRSRKKKKRICCFLMIMILTNSLIHSVTM